MSGGSGSLDRPGPGVALTGGPGLPKYRSRRLALNGCECCAS